MYQIKLPKWPEVERYFKDPELLTAEILFLLFTLCNVFVVYRLFLDVIPFPVFVTWWQLLQGIIMAWIMGDLGREFPKLSYFPQVHIMRGLLRELLVPTLVYCTMLVLANVLLSKTPTPATFPVVVSFTVVLHHVARFVGCGEEYMGLRWQSMLCLFAAFLIGSTDPKTVGVQLLPWALTYAAAAALFRAGYLQRVMHIVEGRGNALHNHQHIIGIVILPVVWILLGEWKALTAMPYNISSLYTWQMWGCLVSAGALPFMKNIISNRLIRRTGQAPWRFLEIVSIFLVFFIGLSFGSPGWQGWISISLVLFGRSLGALDAVRNTEESTSLAPSSKISKPLNSSPEIQPTGTTALLSSYDEQPLAYNNVEEFEEA
ncbi:GAP40 protein [Cardiosporidium cionae]|uniref:GAP40 protein n=1 Tax=Cardiosporidium cionae TaxID=476202 RepID=A0ABQ7JDX1_9APIC|nr:GAP40 protein [Cardiosporidium cionae]|eukprot:KAF8822074.1 GAP40 protein [Cardiosporidium cionae]